MLFLFIFHLQQIFFKINFWPNFFPFDQFLHTIQRAFKWINFRGNVKCTKINLRRVAGKHVHSIFLDLSKYIFLPQNFLGTTPISPPRDTSVQLRHVRRRWTPLGSTTASGMPTQQVKISEMKAVILAYCKQRQMSTVYYFGLVVSENANRNRLRIWRVWPVWL